MNPVKQITHSQNQQQQQQPWANTLILSKNAQSTVRIPINFGATWAKGMEHFSDELRKYLFMYIIVGNQWSFTDHIEAQGDDGDAYRSIDYLQNMTTEEKQLTAKQLS